MAHSRILVADDDAQTRFLLRLIFESADYDVPEALRILAVSSHAHATEIAKATARDSN